MISAGSQDWTLFLLLCRILGGQQSALLSECVENGQLTRLMEQARLHDVLPALAYRLAEQLPLLVECEKSETLRRVLRENTMRNMQITAQALKLAQALNAAGITPLFLKGTAKLLTIDCNRLGFRKQLDIDLLVAQEEIEHAATALCDQGYAFYDFSTHHAPPEPIADFHSAFRISAAHHHLPELMKQGAAALVEIHRHYLPRRFQGGDSLEQVFRTAIHCENRGTRFLVPSPEFQILHMVQGKFIHDGHLRRRSFPLREACDYIHVLEAAEGNIDYALVDRYCRRESKLFAALVSELMAFAPASAGILNMPPAAAGNYIEGMQRRSSSRVVSSLRDTVARAEHLIVSAWHNPGKIRSLQCSKYKQ